MKKTVMLTLLSLCFVLSTAGVSSALMITGGTDGSIPGVPSSAYNDLLGSTSVNGLYGAELSFTAGEQVTFQFIGEEAGYNNAFQVNDSIVFTNNGSAWGDSKTFTVADSGFNFSFLADLGTHGTVYSYDNPDDSAAGVPGPNFFVTNLTDDLILGPGSILGGKLEAGIYLWLDDGGAGSDDNHDDMLIRVSSSAAPVPEPATLLLLGTGLLGLAGYNRKRFSNKS